MNNCNLHFVTHLKKKKNGAFLNGNSSKVLYIILCTFVKTWSKKGSYAKENKENTSI